MSPKRPSADRPTKTPPLFVVVCTDFHMAVGLFGSAEEASKAARKMTAEETSGCQYVPCLIHVEGAKLMPIEDDTGSSHFGQYL